MFKPQFFKLQELVPKKRFDSHGEFCWKFLDPRALAVIDAIRKRYGPMTCNNWSYGGNRTQSGLRVPGQSHYRSTSQHAFGRAFDLIPRDISAHELRADLKAAGLEVLRLPAGVDSVTFEEGPKITWVHVDVRNAGPGVNSFFVG